MPDKNDHCYGCKKAFHPGEEREHNNSLDVLRWMVFWHPSCRREAERKVSYAQS